MKLSNKTIKGIKFLTLGFLLDITLTAFLTLYVTQTHNNNNNNSNLKSGLTEIFTTNEILLASTQSSYFK